MRYLIIISLLFACAMAKGQYVDQLVSYYELSAGASTEPDAVGDNDGTVSGATFTTPGTNPPYGSCYSFDGTNDQIAIGAITLGNNVTIAAWVNASTTGLVSRNAVGRSLSGTDGIGISSGGKWYGQYATHAITSGANYTTGWHHVVYTYSYATSTHVLYVDGAQVATSNQAIDPEGNAAATFCIGSGGSTRYWAGMVDQVALFNIALTSEQVTSLYNSGVARALTSWYNVQTSSRNRVTWFNNSINSIVIPDIPAETFQGINQTIRDTDYDGVCPSGGTWETDCDCAINYFSRAPLRAIADATDFANVKYIDFTNTGSIASGTITEPYNSWDDWSWAANTAYLFKRGTISITSSERVINVNNVLLGTYGTGDTAIIRGSHIGHTISLDGNGNLYTLRDLKFEAPAAYDNIISTDVRNSSCAVNIGKTLGNSEVKVDMIGCQVYHSPFGLRTGYPVAELRVINCKLHKLATEGAYPNGKYLEFRFTHIYDFNRWALTQPEIHLDGGTNNGSTGDGIELTWWNQFFLANSIVDHGSTPNKATIMLHSDDGVWIQEAKIIAYSVLVGPKNGTSAVQTINQSSSAKGLLLKGNWVFESPLNNNSTVGFWNGSAGADTAINNVFVGYGYACWQSATDNSLYDNNTYYDNTRCIYAETAKTIPSFRNNITYNNTNVLENVTATQNSNNVSINPNFVNPTLSITTADFSLQSGSPAINAGATIDYVPIDIEGKERVAGQYDAGAYEH